MPRIDDVGSLTVGETVMETIVGEHDGVPLSSFHFNKFYFV